MVGRGFDCIFSSIIYGQYIRKSLLVGFWGDICFVGDTGADKKHSE
jgi:hypothetical protein